MQELEESVLCVDGWCVRVTSYHGDLKGAVFLFLYSLQDLESVLYVDG